MPAAAIGRLKRYLRAIFLKAEFNHERPKKNHEQTDTSKPAVLSLEEDVLNCLCSDETLPTFVRKKMCRKFIKLSIFSWLLLLALTYTSTLLFLSKLNLCMN